MVCQWLPCPHKLKGASGPHNRNGIVLNERSRCTTRALPAGRALDSQAAYETKARIYQQESALSLKRPTLAGFLILINIMLCSSVADAQDAMCLGASGDWNLASNWSPANIIRCRIR